MPRSFCQAPAAFFRRNFAIQDPPCLFATPAPCLPPNSNFLHPRSQFCSRLLSLSLSLSLSPYLTCPSLFLLGRTAELVAFVG